MVISGQAFQGETISLDGQRFDHCDFMNCILVIRGEQVFQLSSCRMFGSTFRFDGPAVTTISVMKMLYHGMGDGGKQIIEALIDQIRQPSPVAPVSDQ